MLVHIVLPPPPPPAPLQLGSPKEMCLAILEQMDSLSSSGKTTAMFNMLSPLQNGIHIVNIVIIYIIHVSHSLFSSSRSS